tara:strand:+ start:130440 stop:131333 length:894 start_codon:yes stop_codon:yes gene_type:complete
MTPQVPTPRTPNVQPINRNIPKNQRVQPVRIIRPNKPRVKLNESQQRTLKNRRGVKASPVRKSKEVELSRYKEKVQSLKGCGVGRFLVMVACGPSILEVDLPKLHQHALVDFMSINKPDPRLHPTKYWAFCDQSQFARNQEIFKQYTGTVINAWSVRARHQNQVLVRNKSGKGFSKDLLKGYFIGRSTTFANMQTAFWMNYDKIFIFGCDMCKPPGSDKLHFYGRNQDVDPKIRETRFKKEAEFYLAGAKAMTAQERQKFVFCSSYNPWPFMEYFKTLDHKTAVEEIIKMADEKSQK